MDILAQAAERIIQEQERIIGPVAVEQASRVQGISLNWSKREVKLEGDEKSVLEKLVKQYAMLFGKASIEACKEAIHPIYGKIPPTDLPDILKP